jgi:hypothetical protein
MKKVMLAFSIFASVVLVSCGSQSGKREVGKIAKVKGLVSDNINWVRLNTIESELFKVSDTIIMNKSSHTVVYDNSSLLSEKVVITEIKNK